jgi:hypothetical protein
LAVETNHGLVTEVFYVMRFNMALARLGVDPSHLKPAFRRAAQLDGKDNRHTPQEAALMVLQHLPLEFRALADPRVAERWLREGKVSLSTIGIRDALIAAGWADFWS